MLIFIIKIELIQIMYQLENIVYNKG